MKTFYAAVIGSGVFPFDMLRYDTCYPASPKDVIEMSVGNSSDMGELTRPRLVIVAQKCEHAHMFTADRWASFGWQIEAFGENRSSVRDSGIACLELRVAQTRPKVVQLVAVLDDGQTWSGIEGASVQEVSAREGVDVDDAEEFEEVLRRWNIEWENNAPVFRLVK